MTDHKYTDDEIIHSLKVCSNDGDCIECLINPHKGNYGYCTSLAIKAALDLINRQKAEIEGLNAVHADMTESLRLASEANKDMQAELERLNKEVDRLSQCVLYHDGIVSDLEKDLFDARAEAIKEFAERLKKRARMPLGTLYGEMVYFKDIDTLVKEMTEENK